METSEVTDKVKEWCATVVMRDMLFKLAEQEKVSYEKAMLEFTASPIYDALFDFNTGIWKEGPVYLLDLYQEYAKHGNQCQNSQ